MFKIRIFQLYSTAVRNYLLFNCQRHKCHLNTTFTLKKINNIRVIVSPIVEHTKTQITNVDIPKH
uniref:Putative ovule protein n=1 Tax=Solanum chacoense TaxID=4108 RepID=A0A0V0GZ63_SOLCH